MKKREIPKMKKWAGLSCILVANNDQGKIEKSIAALENSIKDQLDIFFEDYEIIIVDDGSTDQSEEILRKLQQTNSRLKVIRQQVPQGFGAAFYSGLSLGRFPLVFISTADYRFEYDQIIAFLSYIDDYDAVIGFRPDRQEPYIFRLASKIWNILVRILFGLQFQDIDCPFKLFKKESLSYCNLNYIRNRDSIINTELLTQLKYNKAKILEAPVSQLPGDLEYQNRIGINLIIRVFFKLLGLRFRLYFQALIGYFGFVTGLFSRTDRPMEMIIFRQSELCLSDSQINCRICGADEKSLRKTNLHTCEDALDLGDFAVYFCTSCQNAFTYPVISEDNIFLQPDIPFEKMTYLQKKMISWFMDIRRKRVVSASEGTKKEELLDIGGGNHGFGNMMAKNGWKVTVLEPNPKNAGYADISLGVKTITNTFSNDLVLTGELKKEEFDLITLWHSLEHLEEVPESLDLINKLLKPGGCLYISVPNLNSLQADIGRNRWAYLDVPHHLSHFTLDGLVQLLNKNGFSQMNIHWTSPEYEVFGFYQTLLNVISLSHNYYYHLNKKGRNTDQSLKYPLLTKTVTSLGFIWLPLAFILSMLASLTGKPACVEIHCYKSPSSSR